MSNSRKVVAAVAKQLKGERVRRGLSMTSLAKQAGLSQQTVSYVERGMRNPTLETLLRIAAVLNADLWRMLKAASKTAGKK